MANTLQPSSMTIPIFKHFFCSQELWEIVDEGFTIPAETSILNATQKKELKESKHKDSKVLLILQQAVADSIF